MKNRLLFFITIILGVIFSADAFGPWKKRPSTRRANKTLALTMDAYAKVASAQSENGVENDIDEESVNADEDEEADVQDEDDKDKDSTEATQKYSEDTQPIKKMSMDVDVKRKKIIALVDKGAAYLQKRPVHDAMQAFSHDKKFVNGELYLFAYDINGICLAHGQESTLVWKNLYNLKDQYGSPIIQEIIKTAQAAPGWLTYQWRGATKITYVRLVRKDNKSYIIGSGYYPHSKQDTVVSLVKGAVALFKEIIAQGRPKEEAFSTFSYPMGKFIFGDLYLYALDFDGLQYAHGELPGLIGTSRLDYRDARGKYVNQEIIQGLKNATDGIWVEYLSRGTSKITYAEKVTDSSGKNYFIACGYYPGVDRVQVENLVKKGYRFMKASGKSAAVREFGTTGSPEYRFGDLSLFIYNMKGDCIAHGENATYVGSNHWDLQDEDGRFYVRELIKKAQEGGGWEDFKLKNAFKTMYVEKIDLGIDQFVIGSGLYPVSKRETMVLLAKSAIGFLKAQPLESAFAEFTKLDGKFIRGDLEVMVFDTAGICYAYGEDHDLIWRDLLAQKDDAGKQFIKTFINTTKRGPGTVSYTLNGATKTAYIEPTEKDGAQYIVGSSFYL